MRSCLITSLLLAAVYLFGLATLATLPPFEAFDEAEYWSAIQQFSDTGQLPRYGDAKVSGDVAAYPGPIPSSSGQPYLSYFSSTHTGATVFTTGPSHFTAGSVLNYEAQHPPLFLFIVRPFYQMFAKLSWPAHFLALRLINWTIAFFGFSVGALTTQRVLRKRNYSLPISMLPLIWPFLFPQFFEEFTRITNDTLCFALVACVWCLLIVCLEQGPNARRSITLGILLGAGLLTKAFFLPVSVGVTLFLIVAAWKTSPSKWALTLAVPLVAALTGGWWYSQALVSTGHLTGASDFIQMHQSSGLLHAATLAPGPYLTGLIQMLFGFCWAGTWSFAHPSRLFLVPIIALVLVPCALYAKRVNRTDLVALAPIFIVAPILAGLLYHLAVMLAETGQSGTPGWFFHLFAGPLSLILALGWGRRGLMLPLVGYAALLDGMLTWTQFAFFSGCLPRTGHGEVHPLDATCFVNVQHLLQLTFSDLGFASGILGIIILIAATILLANNSSSSATRSRQN
jgi:hypothetical protein